MLTCRNICILLLTAIWSVVPGLARADSPSMISPFYFGPNAFPVPEIVDRTSPTLNLSAEANYFYGRRDDHTTDITLRATVPLWTPRVNLTVWLPAMEWYRHSDAFLASCNVPPPYTESMRRGHLTGDVYVTTDIHVLTERRIRPDIVVRAGLKTASGGRSSLARYYDSPGYFFDAAFGKTFLTLPAARLSLRGALECGFLCWQTAVNGQNDAVMFGAKVQARWRRLTLTETIAGYSGWEHLSGEGRELAHDTPVTSRTRLAVSVTDRWSLYGAYEHGLSDYPYNHVTVGVQWSIPILK